MRFVFGARTSGGARGALVAFAAILSATGTIAQAADCNQYAADAKAQSEEYDSLGCTGGNPDWWRVDLDYHRDWCLTKSATSSEPANGTASREGVLRQCRQARRPTVFEGTVCDRWDVLLRQGPTSFSGLWERGEGFFYRARWTGGGTAFDRIVYPLNSNLSFWSEDTPSNTRYFYYNDRSLNLPAGQIGGRWETEAANGESFDGGEWRATCLDPLRN